MSDNPTEKSGLVNRGLDMIAGVDTWKRAFILLLFAVFSFTMVMLYQHPEWVEKAATGLHNNTGAPKLVDAKIISRDLPALRVATNADLVVVFATEVGKNEQWLIAYDAAPEIKHIIDSWMQERWGFTRPFLTEGSPWNPIVIEILNGTTGCFPITPDYIRIKLPNDLTVVCVVGIPPGPDALVGWVGAGYVGPVDRPQAAQVRSMLKDQVMEWFTE